MSSLILFILNLKHIWISFTVSYNVFILFNTVLYLKLNFKIKIDPKVCTFKNLEQIVKFRFETDKSFLSSSKVFLLKSTFKVALQYFFNVVILFNTIIYLRINFKIKIDPKVCTFKNLEEISQKPVATLIIYPIRT